MDKIYLAGPDVFLPDAIAIGRRKKELCAAYGFEGLFPFDNEIDRSAGTERPDRLIFRANESMIRSADIGIFNLTPFRGPSADAGTVFELGMMVGLGKQVFGYSNVAEDLLVRSKQSAGARFDAATNSWRDANRMAIEDFGNADNLMIDNALLDHGGHAMVRQATAPQDRFSDLTAFERCLRLVAQDRRR
jgi:nucleoside 2-deoxyribosyltransferase